MPRPRPGRFLAGQAKGRVEITCRDLSTVIAGDDTDEGTIAVPPLDVFRRGTTTGNGIGLALGRTIAEVGDCRLTLASTDPARFTLLIPVPGCRSASTGLGDPVDSVAPPTNKNLDAQSSLSNERQRQAAVQIRAGRWNPCGRDNPTAGSCEDA